MATMRLQAQWLSREERELIVGEALRLLDEVGMRLGDAAALGALAEAGAIVDTGSGVVRFPPDLVLAALDRCPMRVLLADATDDDCLLDAGAIQFVPSGSPTVTLDMGSGRYRPSTLEDVRRSTIVADAMPPVDILWAPVSATDVPPEKALFPKMLTMLAWSGKHLQDDLTEPWQVEPVLAVMETLCGSLEAFRARPRLSFCCCTTSPIAVDGTLLDASIGIASHGAPILVYPMPIADVTVQTIMADAVARAGFSGHFIGHDETRRRVRAGEVFMPSIATRLSLDAWKSDGRDERARATETVGELLHLADERGPALGHKTIAALEEIVDDAAAARP